MYEDMAVKLAKIMTGYSIPVEKGDVVAIAADSQTAPLVRALYEAVLRRGGHPVVYGSGVSGLEDLFLELADEDQLQFENPLFRTVVHEATVLYNIFSPHNTKSRTRVDNEKLKVQRRSRQAMMKTMMERMETGDLRACILPWPSQGLAQEAEMSLLAYTRFIYEACALHLPDPVAYWTNLRDRQLKLVEYLKDKREVLVKGPGIELRFNFEGRLWASAHGNENFPDGEIYTGPVEDSVNGYVRFNLPTIYGGHEVTGVYLVFRDGAVVEASADKGEDFLLSQLDADEGARRLGEFAIGTNDGIQEVTGSTLFDEKIGGTIHMALGQSYPETNAVNESAVHWDMVHGMKDGGEIHIDGKLFYQAGEFKV